MNTNENDNPGQGHGNGHDDDHGNGHGGHSKTTIIVNTREKEVEGKEIRKRVCRSANATPSPMSAIFAISAIVVSSNKSFGSLAVSFKRLLPARQKAQAGLAANGLRMVKAPSTLRPACMSSDHKVSHPADSAAATIIPS